MCSPHPAELISQADRGVLLEVPTSLETSSAGTTTALQSRQDFFATAYDQEGYRVQEVVVEDEKEWLSILSLDQQALGGDKDTVARSGPPSRHH